MLDRVDQVIPGGDWRNAARNEQKTLLTACGGLVVGLK